MIACICGGIFETLIMYIVFALGGLGLMCKNCTIHFKKKDK